MRTARLSFITALLSLAVAAYWIFRSNPVPAVIWLVIAVVWLGLAIKHAASEPEVEDQPVRRLARRLSRLLLYWG
jgi:uncharacterized membrane protein